MSHLFSLYMHTPQSRGIVKTDHRRIAANYLFGNENDMWYRSHKCAFLPYRFCARRTLYGFNYDILFLLTQTF